MHTLSSHCAPVLQVAHRGSADASFFSRWRAVTREAAEPHHTDCRRCTACSMRVLYWRYLLEPQRAGAAASFRASSASDRSREFETLGGGVLACGGSRRFASASTSVSRQGKGVMVIAVSAVGTLEALEQQRAHCGVHWHWRS
eukprot:scaffold325822_cov57-Tisochrysis_lutea.AAC.1